MIRSGLGVLLLITITVTGCSIPTPQKSPPKQTYLLQGDSTSDSGGVAQFAATEKSCVSLRIGLPRSAPGLNTPRIAYSRSPNQVEYFAFHHWVDTPAQMLAWMMETRLDQAELFGFTVSGAPDTKTGFRLDTELLALQQDFAADGTSVTLAVKVTLVALGDRALLRSKTFRYSEPARADSAQAGVVAANIAAETFISDLMTWLSEWTETLDCP